MTSDVLCIKLLQDRSRRVYWSLKSLRFIRNIS